jgi:hypothetical protein
MTNRSLRRAAVGIVVALEVVSTQKEPGAAADTDEQQRARPRALAPPAWRVSGGASTEPRPGPLASRASQGPGLQ